MAHHNLTTSALACASHLLVSFKEGVLQHEVHLLNLTCCEIFTNSNVSHYKVTCNATSSILCGSSLPNRILMGLPALRAGKPQLPCELWAHKRVRCLFVNPRDISTIHLTLKGQNTWSWLRATSLGHKTNV